MQPVFIGDEVTGAAYRLAGFDVRVASPAQSPAALEQALGHAAPAILITAECAAALPDGALDAALARCDPPVAVVPDAADRVPLPDYAARVGATLGIAG